MNKKSSYVIFILFFVLLFIGPINALPNIPTNIYQQKGYTDIFNIYYKNSSTEKTINFIYTINKIGNIDNKTTNYRDIIIGDITGLKPKIINNKSGKLIINVKLENTYFLTYEQDIKNKDCINELKFYYNALPFTGPYNLTDKEVVIEKFIQPITKQKIIDYLSNKKIKNPEDCFKTLINKKILLEYPIFLTIESELKGKETDFEKDFNFIVTFEPEFINPVKPITGKLRFIKEPFEITSIYSVPNEECKTKTDANFCYITTKDLFVPESVYTTEKNINIDRSIRRILSNFTVVYGFKDMSFEGTNVKELLVNIALKRERFCFKEENNEYTETIFRVAKAYDLSLEQTFQLWAIISERSNCNYQVNPNRYGFAQIDLKNRDTGNLIEIDPNLPQQLAEEEQFQYLAVGNFKEINDYLYEVKYKKNKSLFYNLGYNGIINNDNGYFGFLINAIKNNKDEYGSTILFTSDYLKELNYLIKNSRDKSSNPYAFDNFIFSNPENINSLYLLANLISEENIPKRNQIYSAGNYSEIFSISSFFIKEKNHIKTTKEIRVLINYLAIKRKYLEAPEYFSNFNVISQSKDAEYDKKINNYEKLDANYWGTKKDKYLKIIKEKNWSLILKKNKNFNNYDSLISIKGTPNYCARYVTDFGQQAYLNGIKKYPQTNANAWTYDTNPLALDAFNVIWEAKDICNNKKICSSAPTSKDCCNETSSAQDGKTKYVNYDLFVDGAILGIYVPGGRYNNINREYTHVAMYIGKTIYGTPLITESISSGQSISILDKNVKDRIKRIYIPKDTNIKNINEIVKIQSNYPSTYVLMSSKKLQELIKKKESRGDTEYNYENYYEDVELPGEGDEEEIEDYSADISETANNYLNRPYNYAGRDSTYIPELNRNLKKDVDCVGLLYVTFRDLGYINNSLRCVELFRNGWTIADFIEYNKGNITGNVGVIAKIDDLDYLMPGDLLFLTTKSGGLFGHAGIYIATENGTHKYIHASGTPNNPDKVKYATFEEELEDKSIRFPVYYARITGVDKANIDCSSNLVSVAETQGLKASYLDTDYREMPPERLIADVSQQG